MPSERTDAEVVCEWMSAMPSMSVGEWGRNNEWEPDWWEAHEEIAGEWQPLELDLDALHLVEERLSEERWEAYTKLLLEPVQQYSDPAKYWRTLIHADSPTKLAALASVIRGVPDEIHNLEGHIQPMPAMRQVGCAMTPERSISERVKQPRCVNCGRAAYHHSTWLRWCPNGITKYQPTIEKGSR